MKRTIYLSAGHSINPKRDRGAISGSYVEGNLTSELRMLVYRRLQEMGASVRLDAEDSILADTLAFFRKLISPKDIAVDIHFNAAGSPLATGTETLVPEKPTDFEVNLAHEISVAISGILDIPLRGTVKGKKGVKTELDSHHGRLGFMRLDAENVLPEVCFITSKKDMDAYMAYKGVVADSIARILYEYSKEDKDPNTWVVKAGDTLWGIHRSTGIALNRLIDLNPGIAINNIRVGQIIRLS